MARVLHMRDLFLGLDLSLVDTLKLFVYMSPSFLLIVFPIACMVSVFLTFLRMSADRELIALKAGGIGVYQFLRAPAIFSTGCLILALFMSLYGISWGMGNFRSLVLQIASTRAKVTVQPGVFNQDIFHGLTLFARKVEPATGKLLNVVFEDTTQEKNNALTIIAPEGEIGTDEKNGLLVFLLKDGRIYRTEENNMSVLEFSRYAVRMDLGKMFQSVSIGEIKPKEMPVNTLLEMMVDPEVEAHLQRRAEVEFHKRISLPFACLILGLFALPLACLFEGVRQQMGVIFSFLLFFMYYSLFSFGMSLSEAGTFPPVFGLWIANIIFAFGAILGINLAAKEKVISLRALFSKIPFFHRKRVKQ